MKWVLGETGRIIIRRSLESSLVVGSENRFDGGELNAAWVNKYKYIRYCVNAM